VDAAMAVVDIRAITQLVQQIRTMQQQLETARSQLTQAQSEFQSMTGGRAMESLLAGTVRNYLPADWAQLDQALRGTIGAYGALAAELQSVVDSNAVLSSEQVAALSPWQREQLNESRRSAAMLQVTARQALANSSDRFAAIQQLIDAIPRATDQKAILDLQARIAAEQGMLQNEQTKLDILERTAQAEELSRRQRIREQAIADIGSLRRLPAMGL
jgi:type IV secretion system protein VirB5